MTGACFLLCISATSDHGQPWTTYDNRPLLSESPSLNVVVLFVRVLTQNVSVCAYHNASAMSRNPVFVSSEEHHLTQNEPAFVLER